VSVSAQGYECFEADDLAAVHWLQGQLETQLQTSLSTHLGAACYHLKERGGIKQATTELKELLASGQYPYIIRSDAKAYYAHIRHHKLIHQLREGGFSDAVCRVTTSLCQRMTVRGGVYTECQQGIPLGCAASPLLAAIYLAPLDRAISAIPGVRYLRYMDDWIILCPSRWKLRRAVRVMHQSLTALGLRTHPDKTFIGKTEKGFDFLGIQFQAGEIQPSRVSLTRLLERLEEKFSHAARLYEQGELHSLEFIEQYLTHWQRYQQGIGVASSVARSAFVGTLKHVYATTPNVFIQLFSEMTIRTFLKQTKNQSKIPHEKNMETQLGGSHLRRNRICHDINQPSGRDRLLGRGC
jgi:hypothetical protein